MADFLTNILVRSFNQGPMLERRAPSMFEPTKNSHLESRVTDSPLEELIQELNPPARPVQRAKPYPHRAVPASTLEQSVPVLPTHVPQPSLDVDPSVAHHMESEPILEQSVCILPTRDPQPTFDVDRSATRHPEPPLPALIKEIIVERERVHTERKRLIAEERHPIAFVPVEHVVRQEVLVDRTVALSSSEVSSTDAKINRGSVGVPTLVRLDNSVIHFARKQPRSSMAVPESSLPTINVTIGRVEVRATSSSQAVQRSGRVNKPKLSLEEYLQSRSGGTK